MTRERLNSLGKAFCLSAMVGLGTLGPAQAGEAQGAGADEIPTFRYDPDWPKQLPNNWTTGVIGAIYITKDDHIWVATRPSSVVAMTETYYTEGLGDCCAPAPPVMEFDTEGNVLKSWGPIHKTEHSAASKPGDPYAPGTEVLFGKQPKPAVPVDVWPASEHAMFVDYKGNVWVSSQLNPSQLLKFTNDGKFIRRFGTHEAKSSLDTANFAGPTGVYVDPQTNEVYISDGYRNRRIIVLDADTGAFKRMWGAYGKPPTDPQQIDAFGSDRKADQFSVTHCIVPDNNGLLYVCDRVNSRVQVFKKDGTYVREVVLGDPPKPSDKTHLGSAWSVAFSPDKEQRFMYVADGTNKKIWIVRRSDMKILGTFGHGGRQGGQFETIHCLAVDSHGNIYTGETLSGNRVQRFLYTGTRPISASK